MTTGSPAGADVRPWAIGVVLTALVALEAEQRLARLNPALAERLLRAIEGDGAARRGR